jgi:hypothetical protein
VLIVDVDCMIVDMIVDTHLSLIVELCTRTNIVTDCQIKGGCPDQMIFLRKWVCIPRAGIQRIETS